MDPVILGFIIFGVIGLVALLALRALYRWIFGAPDPLSAYLASARPGEPEYYRPFEDDLIKEETNPATGLPMCGGVDLAGNPYGSNDTAYDD